MPTNPGSPEAMRLGCKCSPLGNHYGDGAVVEDKINPNVFVLDPDCPIHTDARRLRDKSGGENEGGGDAGDEPAAGDTSYPVDAPALDDQPLRASGDTP